MKNKLVGIKEFQAKLAKSFPQKDELTIVTKHNVPTYAISNLRMDSGEGFSLLIPDIKICPTCGQEIKGVSKSENTD